MKVKAVSEIMLTLLLISMLMLVFNIQPVKSDWTWTETIYIKADGSIYPDTAPISSVDNVTYTLTDNIVDVPGLSTAVIVQRDNIVVDGAGYTLQGIYGGSESKGISLNGRNNVKIRNMKIIKLYYGIWLYSSSNSSIIGNNIDNYNYGIYLSGSSNNSIVGNNITNNKCGIWFSYSLNNIISGNNITNNTDGFLLWHSSNNNSIVGNNITENNHRGILLSCSSNTVLRNNIIADNDHNFGVEGSTLSHFITHEFTSNTVDGKPIYYLINQKNLVIDPSTYPNIGYLALVNSTNITVQGLELKNNYEGVLFAYTTNSKITNNNIPSNFRGIALSYSSNNTISGNTVTNNEDGIAISSSNYNHITGNNITNNSYSGIRLWDSSNNTVSGNNITNNFWVGINPRVSSNNSITGNNITNNHCGIHLYLNSNYNSVTGNNITNNSEGIVFRRSNYNHITGNNITNNSYSGISLDDSSNNKFYHNNFLDNPQQVYIETSGYANVWDDGYPSGGNYWSDYSGVDLYSGPDQDQLGSDGIGDTSYIIDNDNIDHYPLISSLPQTPDFDIVVSPSTGTTAQGTTLTTNVYVSTIAGYNYLVSLSASGQPEGITINFNPNNGTPYFTSTMTIQVGYSVPPNVYSINVTGLGSDGKTHSTTYTLTVTPPAVPEFPLGGAIEIALILAIVFIWFKKRRKNLQITVP